MKKTFLGIGLLISLIALAPAYGQNEEAAIVLKDLDHPTGCYATSLDPDGDPLFTKTRIHTVANSSGNVKLTCHFDLPKDVHLSRPFKDFGFLCGIYLPKNKNADDFHYVFTTRTSFQANPGGKATLICEIKANQLS
jgi:hypothetical protein